MDNIQLSQKTQKPVVPVSDQPLTLDPNNMTEPQAVMSQPLPVQPPAPSASGQQPSPQPQYPVSGPLKEMAPIPQAPVTEYVRPSEVEPQLPDEVKEAGMEVVENKERPQLTADHKALGIEHAKESVPVVVSPTSSVQLPYTLQDAKLIEKQVPRTESRHWLAALTEYIWRKMQAVAG